MISATGDFNAQSKVLSGSIVHGIKIIMVLIVVNILFFILIKSFLIGFVLPAQTKDRQAADKKR